MKTRTLCVAITFALAGAAAAQASTHDNDNRMSFSLFAGGNASMPGSFQGPNEAFNSTDPPGTAYYDHLDISGAFQHRYTGGAELDYAFNPRLAAFGRASYSQFNGSTERIGTFDASATDEGALTPVNASFDDTRSRALDFGARYTFAPGARLRPFVGASLGATWLSATNAAVDNLNGTGTTNVQLTKASTVFAQRLETGLQYSPMDNFDVRLTAAASHLDGARLSNDPNLATIGLESASADGHGQWSYPVEVGAVWHF